jgi:hypothetical protein
MDGAVSARLLIASVALSLAAATSAAARQQFMPSLAEVARKAEAAKPSQAKAKKSYTNADLHAMPAADPVTPAAAAAPAGGVTAATGTVIGEDASVKTSQEMVDATTGHNMPEEHWRQRADFIRSQVTKVKGEMARLSIPVPGRSAILEARNANEMRKNQQALDGLKKQWALLEESARIARVPADWIGTNPTESQQ